MNTPRTVAEIVGLWPSNADMAADLGGDVKEYMPRDWARRGRIPAERWAAVVAAAGRRVFPVTLELLAAIHAAETEAHHEPA